MKNLIELNREIESIVKPEVYFHDDYQTFSFFGNWVIEIEDEYFKNWEERIKDKINLIADLDSPIKVKFLKIFHQDVLEKYKEIIKHRTDDLEYLMSIYDEKYKTHKSINKPKKSCKDISSDENSIFYITPEEYEYAVDKLFSIFYNDIQYQDDDYTIETGKSEIDNCIIEYFENEHKKIEEEISKKREERRSSFQNAKWAEDDIESHLNQFYPFIKVRTKEEQLEKAYSFLHLSTCLDKTRVLLKNIIKHLDNLVNIIKKLENFEEDKLTAEEVFASDPNNLKLEFKISKKEIAMFFKNLADFGFINVDNQGIKTEYTQLKKYIDNSNMYFTQNTEIKPVKGINKEFSKVYADDERPLHIPIEKKFLKNLITKLTDRVKDLEIEEKG